MKYSTLMLALVALLCSGLLATCSDDLSDDGATANGDADSDGDGDGDSDGDSDSDADGDTECGSTMVDFSQQTPTVLLVIDRSGSMTTGFGGDSRWNVAREALVDPSTGFVAVLEDEIRFGLSMYAGEYDDGITVHPCPYLEGVNPALNNYDEIAAVYNASNPLSNTPTAEAVEAATATLTADTAPGSKVIVLVTDGEPDTCENPDAQNGQPQSVSAVESAFSSGVLSYIISVGSEVGEDHLQDLADAGINGEGVFYQANDQQALVAAFNSIINGVRACIFNLNGSVDPDRQSECVVTINGDTVPYDDPNGWDLTGPSQMELRGDSCQEIQTGDVVFAVDCPCGVVTPIE